MGKREDIKSPRHSRDFYPTVDPVAARVLLDYIGNFLMPAFIEPCAGDGRLGRGLVSSGKLFCMSMWDIEPQKDCVKQLDCTKATKDDIYPEVDYFITNPPFSWTSLQPILDTLPKLLPTWLLLPADMMHNVRMGPYMKRCSTILSIGRMYWFEDKPVKGVDNFMWTCFEADECETRFIGR